MVRSPMVSCAYVIWREKKMVCTAPALMILRAVQFVCCVINFIVFDFLHCVRVCVCVGGSFVCGSLAFARRDKSLVFSNC